MKCWNIEDDKKPLERAKHEGFENKWLSWDEIAEEVLCDCINMGLVKNTNEMKAIGTALEIIKRFKYKDDPVESNCTTGL